MNKLFLSTGSDFLCATHIIPVKNQEGVVMMFILSFDYVLKEGSMDSLDRLNHTSPTRQEQSEASPFLFSFCFYYSLSFSFPSMQSIPSICFNCLLPVCQMGERKRKFQTNGAWWLRRNRGRGVQEEIWRRQRKRENGFICSSCSGSPAHCQDQTQSARKEMKWGKIIYVTQCYNYLDP